MKYDHVVKYNGEYYMAGQEVPMEEPFEAYSESGNEQEVLSSDFDFGKESKMYSYQELEEMTAKEIRKIAESKGIRITKTIKDDIIKEFLSKQG